MAERGFAREARTIGLAWLALVALMLASLGSAYLKLGALNAVAGLAIATVKGALVAWLFMRLRDAGRLIRLAAFAGLGLWAIQLALTGVDYATRQPTAAPVQAPRQLPALTAAATRTP